ncbi:E3 ubiquitin-protein ligase HERC2-like [Macaca nemestrina]|uniref:E3 ubiquitin-protein ligase HERC2-like n=1 Tax=Macaca nemestrina TaxID=9545 RepID=UPI0039B860F2
MFTERQAPKGQKRPPAGPALGPGHPAGAGCAERHAEDTNAPLLPLLQRFQSIICRKDTPHSEGDMHLLSGPLSPSESFLRYLTLPQDSELATDLRQTVVVVMGHLDRLATPFASAV